MGNNNSSNNKKRALPPLGKQQFEVMCLKVKAFVELVRDQKAGVGTRAQGELLMMFSRPKEQRRMQEEKEKAIEVIMLSKFVEGCRRIIVDCDSLRSHSFLVIQNQNNPSAIEDFICKMYTIIWAAPRLNVDAALEFAQVICSHYGINNTDVQNSDKVDKEVKEFLSVQRPSPVEINAYVLQLAQTGAIDLNKVNEIGHNFSSQSLLASGKTNQAPPPQQPPSNNPYPQGGGGGVGGGGGDAALYNYPSHQAPPANANANVYVPYDQVWPPNVPQIAVAGVAHAPTQSAQNSVNPAYQPYAPPAQNSVNPAYQPYVPTAQNSVNPAYQPSQGVPPYQPYAPPPANGAYTPYGAPSQGGAPSPYAYAPSTNAAPPAQAGAGAYPVLGNSGHQQQPYVPAYDSQQARFNNLKDFLNDSKK